jgi:penicillin-insensitive murein endopeptidase
MYGKSAEESSTSAVAADHAANKDDAPTKGNAAHKQAVPNEQVPALRTIDREPPVDLGPATDAASTALDQALIHAGDRVVGWWKPLPDQPDFQTLLDPNRQFEHTLSIGTVGRGSLLNAATIPLESEYHSVIERHRHRHTQFGSEALINVILHGAEAVITKHPGPKLRVGNMSREHGGDIPWSSSHNSGRDADLAFFCKRKSDGEPVLAPDLLAFDSRGVATKRPELVFDTARNWTLVEAMLTHKEIHIQWLFVSNPLKKLMLDHAREQGVSPQIIARAEKVLHQPTDAAPHDDHFHLRITCPANDRVEGCLDYGPRWEWVDWHYDALLARSMALAGALREPKAATRIRALELLERIRSPYAPELALAAALHEDSDEVRQRALEVATSIPNWSGAAVGAALRFIEQDRFSIDNKAFAYEVLRRAVDDLAVEPLKRRITNLELNDQERLIAARSLVHFMEPTLVPFLLEQLGRQPASVRAELAVVLRRVTNRSEKIDWSRVSEDAKKEGLANWTTWWDNHREEERDTWLAEGFIAHGFDRDDIFEPSAAGELISMLRSAPAHVAYNANLTLKRVTGRWAPIEAWSNQRLHRYWSKWWRQNRQRLLASR